jgi:anti-sigma factor RsiW
VSEHQTERFSEALDRVLTSSQQRKFEQHLSTCDKCTTDYEQYRATIAKVRALPLAKMPVPVRIPADMAPRHSFAEGILGYLRRGRGVPTAIALVAAAGILVFASRQTSTTNPPGAASALRPAIVSPANGLNASQAQAAAGLSVPKAADSTVSCVAALLPGPASPPSTYSNVVTVRGSNGAATEITIAAPSATVHAGDSIAVFAPHRRFPSALALMRQHPALHKRSIVRRWWM